MNLANAKHDEGPDNIDEASIRIPYFCRVAISISILYSIEFGTHWRDESLVHAFYTTSVLSE